MKNIILLLLIVFIGLSANAQIFDIRGIKQPVSTSPVITLAPSTFTTFTTVTGTPSANQTTAVSGSNLTANITVTCVSGYEISVDGSTWVTTTRTFTQSGGSASGTLYCRIAAGSAAGTYSGNLSFTSAGAATINIPLSGVVTSGTPTITSTATSLTNTSNVTGSPSASQSFMVSGSTLAANITLAAPTNFEISVDGGSTWGASKTLTQSGGTVTASTVFERTAASAGVGTPSGNIALTSTGATTVNVAVSGTVTSGGTKDSMFVNMDTTQLMAVGNGWKNMTGDPHLNIKTTTNTSGLLTMTTVATGNWFGYSGNSAYPSNGNASYTGFPAQAVKEVFYSFNGGTNNFDPYSISSPKFHVSGLKTGSTYSITIGGSITFAFNSNTEYRVNGNALVGPTDLNCLNNTSNVVTFSSVVPSGTGTIDIYVNAASGQDMGVVTAIQIREN